jgi:hypothetical protein
MPTPEQRSTSSPAPIEGRGPRLSRALRFELAMWGVGFVVFLMLLRGLAPILPGVAIALRALLNPCTLALVFALAVIWRLGRGSRTRPTER